MTSNAAELKHLPAAHLHTGARFMGLHGWAVPAHFGDPEAEYNAARTAVALFDASAFTKVGASGRDHIEYLNRRLSQRVIDMPPGETARANQLNGEGRMEADLEFLRLDPAKSLLFAPPAVAGEYLRALADKYVFSEDAVFTDDTSRWASFAVIGPKAGELLKSLGLAAPEPGANTQSDLAGEKVILFRSEFLFGSVVILVSAEHAAAVHTAIAQATTKLGGRPIGFLAFDTLRVESGTPWWGIDLNERSIPLEADLMSAIHTNKGCYPGQETIAKVLNLGHPARKLTGILWDGEDPPPADTVLLVEGREAGRLTSSTFSPRLGRAIGLAMMKWPYRQPDTDITTADGLAGLVHSLPFD